MALRLLKRCKWWYNYDMDSKRNGDLSVIKNFKLDRRVKVTNHIEVGSENMQLGWIDFSKEDRQKASLSIAIPDKYEDEICKLYPTDIFRHLRCL